MKIFFYFGFLFQCSVSFLYALDCKEGEPGCTNRHYRHFQVLNRTLDGFLKKKVALASKKEAKAEGAPEGTEVEEFSFAELGKETETVYHSAWVQRFENGMIVHLGQHAPFTPQKVQSHDGSSFVMQFDPVKHGNGRFFFQWTPRIEGIYDVDLFKSILEAYPRKNELSDWPTVDKVSDSELTGLFRPHTEMSPINLSGGLAVFYAMYRLDQYIGKPLEQMHVQMVLRRNFEKGILLSGMPELQVQSTQSAPSEIKNIFFLKIEKEGKDDPDTNKYGGGKKTRLGSFSNYEADFGKSELQNRPKKGML